MNRPDKAGEPSMEEILASIRQIIADEPSAEQPEPAIEPNPLVPQSLGAKSGESRAPLSDRLNSVLRSGPLPPTSPLGSKRPLSFDQDLADMFDEPESANGSAVAAPKPDMRMPEGLSHPMARKSFVPSQPEPTPPEPEEEPAKPVLDGAAAMPPQLAPSEPLVPPPPFGSSTEKAPVASPPPATFGFPPLRKASFYPPQPKTPAPAAAAPSPSPQANPPAGAPVQSVPPVDAGAGRVAPATAEAPSHGFGTLGAASAPPAPEPQVVDTGPAFGAAPSVGGVSAVEAAAPQARANDAGASASPFPAFTPSNAASSAPVQPEPERAGFTEASSLAGTAHPSFHAADVRRDPPPAEPRPFAGPFTASPPAGSGFADQSRFAIEPDASSSVAAHQALDALAQGLAASAAASSVAQEAPSKAIPLTPVIEPEVSVHSAPTPSNLPAPVPSGSGDGGLGPRTLEDAVAEMLRPMLQQWVADNMPRIIERALRTEVASTMRPGQKPPGT